MSLSVWAGDCGTRVAQLMKRYKAIGGMTYILESRNVVCRAPLSLVPW